MKSLIERQERLDARTLTKTVVFKMYVGGRILAAYQMRDATQYMDREQRRMWGEEMKRGLIRKLARDIGLEVRFV